jgi:flagellar biosynthesis protein FlhA
MAKVGSTPWLANSILSKRSELVLAIALLGVLAVLLIPLPPIVLDLLLGFNLAITVLLVLITLSATRPLDFSVFPSLLLLMTLFRLALNVATTRLILLNGNAGHIVETFGRFVVGGEAGGGTAVQSLVVGLVVFLILVIIQFVVITKGASRISEVAARFTLDSLPGKQMAIDAELNTGAIDDKQARIRRDVLMRETEFYGAMDGASKFVRGDAIAGVIITAINLIGGMIIGLTKSMGLEAAANKYSVLTVGDGLVSQIPALLIATASGMLVTKATTQSTLGSEIGEQVTTNTRPITLGALIVLAMSFIPGMPWYAFIPLAGILFFYARSLNSSRDKEKATAAQAAAAGAAGVGGQGGTAKPAEIPLEDFLQVDRACVEIGTRLIPLVDPKRGTGLIDRIGGLRRDLARKNGLWVPPIRVRDNFQLEAETYRILVGGREVARGHLRPDRWLAIDPGTTRLTIDGEATRDPAFGLPAKWIAENDRQRAELGGYTVVDAPNVLVTHLGEVVRRHASELLSREDLKNLVDKARESSPSVVDELIPNILTMGQLHRVLTLLLEERVPISNLTRILESLANHAPTTKDSIELTDRVRVDLGRSICDRFRDEQGRIHALVLDPRLELELRRAIHEKTLVLDPSRLEKLIVRLANEWRKATARGQDVALLADASLRRPLRHAVARSLPDLAVVAYQEVPGDMLLEPAALIKPEDLA